MIYIVLDPTGAGSGLVPMYLTEISPVNIRGAMGVVHQFALTCGIFISQCMGLQQAMGKLLYCPLGTCHLLPGGSGRK